MDRGLHDRDSASAAGDRRAASGPGDRIEADGGRDPEAARAAWNTLALEIHQVMDDMRILRKDC